MTAWLRISYVLAKAQRTFAARDLYQIRRLLALNRPFGTEPKCRDFRNLMAIKWKADLSGDRISVEI